MDTNISASASPFDQYRARCEQQQQLICELWNDVLALKEHKQRYAKERDLLQTLIDTMPDYIFIKDYECRFVLNNIAHLRLLHVSQSEARGKTDFDFFPSHLAGTYHEDDQTILKNGNPIIDREEKTVGPDGGELWLSSTKVPLRDPDGKIIGIIGISRDLTHRKQAAEEQARLEQQLRQSQKLEALGSLTGGIAHDFNNMLCAIRGYTELIKRELKPTDTKLLEYLCSIDKASGSATALTGKLLAFARKGSCQTAPLDLHECIESVIDLLSRTIDRRIDLVRRLEAQNSIIEADRALMENAVLNIAVNSRDAMPQGGILTFETRTREIAAEDYLCNRLQIASGSYIRLCITDTGTGMDTATIERAFEPFFTTKEPGKGTGLGLAGVYGTVKSHHGGVYIQSEPGKGTSLIMYLPLTHSPAAQNQLMTHSQLPDRHGTVLIVDDEEMVRNMTASFLQEQGYRTLTCIDGQEAVEFYRLHHREIDLVIVDMIMPRLGGPDCIIALRKINPALKTIVMSGFSKPEDTSRIPTIGVAGYLQKPFDGRELLKLVALAMQTTANKPWPGPVA